MMSSKASAGPPTVTPEMIETAAQYLMESGYLEDRLEITVSMRLMVQELLETALGQRS
jgi:hypothetical protein